MSEDDPMPAVAEDAPPADAGPALPLLRLKRGEDRRLRAGHLWVYSNEVDIAATPLTAFAPGAHARVQDWRDQFLGYAYVNPHALICARLLSRSPVQPPDRSLLVHRLKVALALRERHYAVPHYRWVFGEGDGLPGLVLDRYGEVIVGQIATAGMEALSGEIETAGDKGLAPQALVWKNDGGARDLEELPRQVITGLGKSPEELQVIEGGLPVLVAFNPAHETRR